MENQREVCQHPLSSRLQIGWWVQLCGKCGTKIPTDIPSYPKDGEIGRKLLDLLKEKSSH